jgi:RNA polymerase sigma-70 factor (ECF subfamily)
MDKSIIDLFVSGNKNAFENLYNEYFRLIFKVVYPRINDYEKTSEICQDIFFDIYQSRKSYNGGNIKYWVLSIANNITSDWIKKEMKRKEADMKYVEIENNRDFVEDNLERELLEQARNILDSKSYEIIVMHYLERLKFKDIAKYYNCTISVVTSIASRAIKKLKTECKI